jgi:N-acetylglucosaminyldiphosphoundecaprenol N-acetyl-beta-D-mannosaminyltransferase
LTSTSSALRSTIPVPTAGGVVPEKQLVAGVGISKTTYRQVVELVRYWAQHRNQQVESSARYICVVPVYGIVMAHRDSEMSGVLNSADIATPDGMPVVWAMRSLGTTAQQRVRGPSLMLELCRDAAKRGTKIFLYGGRETTLPILENNLRSWFPGLIIAGRYSPPFRPLTESENLDVQERIRRSDADLVFVGIGMPKQERWMYDHRQCFPGVTMIGVGAAFDFYSGRTRQAPSWMQHAGLEWLFRLLMEPRRLWRRYLMISPGFFPLWFKQWWGSRSDVRSEAHR